jgi:5-methyltetrahydropteroyltriglutamate--homocysteine methyltransferase
MILMPGMISHATNIVEHPELIARRLVDWAGIVGPENVVGGADCGMGGRVHPELNASAISYSGMASPGRRCARSSWPLAKWARGLRDDVANACPTSPSARAISV